ncbi:MAG: PAS domain-containing protein, partial [Longimicrobiales bacterium]
MNTSPTTPTAASAGVALTDSEGRIASASDDLLALLERPGSDVIGAFVTDLVAPTDVPALAGAYRRALDEGLSAQCQLHITVPEGRPRVVEARVFALRDAQGRDRSVALSLHRAADDNDRAQAEAAIREQAERLQTIIDGAQLGTWDWHVPSGAVSFNERWAAILGYRPTELSPDLATWETLVHPHDRDDVMAALTDHLEGRAPLYRAEYRLRHQDGHDVWVQDVGRVLERDERGDPVRAAGILLDVTARMEALEAARESLAKFRTLFESQPLGVALTDPSGELVEVNAAAEEFLGTSLAEQAGPEVDDERWRILRPDGSPMPPDEFASVIALREGRRVDG